MQEAKVNVKLPSDAKLYVDDQLTASSNKEVRSFKTPALAVGQDYYYTMRAEYVRDGKPVSTSKRVIVRAGTTVDASFDAPAAVAAR
jgi:uncharacterized protein (TIGR03000 family)